MVRFQEMVPIITLWNGQGYSQENQITEWLAFLPSHCPAYENWQKAQNEQNESPEEHVIQERYMLCARKCKCQSNWKELLSGREKFANQKKCFGEMSSQIDYYFFK